MTAAIGDPRCVNASGKMSFPGTAALIRDARLLVSNDSAPVHLASAIADTVIEIYGATVPEFGFTPFGVPHRIVQRDGFVLPSLRHTWRKGLSIATFECMKSIAPREVLAAARGIARASAFVNYSFFSETGGVAVGGGVSVFVVELSPAASLVCELIFCGDDDVFL